MNRLDLILIIPKEETEQTLESVLALPFEIQESLSDYCMTTEEFIRCINVANGLEQVKHEPYKEMAEDVMDCITCGSYFIIQHELKEP